MVARLIEKTESPPSFRMILQPRPAFITSSLYLRLNNTSPLVTDLTRSISPFWSPIVGIQRGRKIRGMCMYWTMMVWLDMRDMSRFSRNFCFFYFQELKRSKADSISSLFESVSQVLVAGGRVFGKIGTQKFRQNRRLGNLTISLSLNHSQVLQTKNIWKWTCSCVEELGYTHCKILQHIATHCNTIHWATPLGVVTGFVRRG